SNLDELQGRLRASVMVRRLKQDVLTELPDKRRQVVPLRPQTKVERDALKSEEPHKQAIEKVQRLKAELEKLDPVAAQQAYEAMAAELHEAQATAFTETSKVRHEVGLAKVPQCVEHIKDVLDGSDGKLVVWAHHHDVIDALVEAIAGHLGHHTAVLEADGRMSAAHRDEAVQAFQSNPDARVIVCGIAAMGTGHTLTAASHEVFCELDWTPGRVEQAEDRLHRIGQRDNVLAQHLIYDGSLDARMLGLLVGKANVIKAALDAPDTVLPAVEPVAIPEAPKPEKSRVQQILDRHQFRPVCERCGGRVRQITDPFNGKTAWECVAECGWIGSQRLPEASVPAPEAPKSDELPRTQVQAIHQALRILDGSCDGAIAKDDVGFNGTDTGFGKSLAAQEWLTQRQAKAARKMLLKYHRQIPPDLYATLKG
ncbi:MAG: SWF/SNF helicase family protein, partial [Alphaproteobacteria bacterium]|nr:SWF/SNF helicase family protein [Alphaproteobacteria bacterium]